VGTSRSEAERIIDELTQAGSEVRRQGDGQAQIVDIRPGDGRRYRVRARDLGSFRAASVHERQQWLRDMRWPREAIAILLAGSTAPTVCIGCSSSDTSLDRGVTAVDAVEGGYASFVQRGHVQMGERCALCSREIIEVAR
jgi:hypothetical protein